MTKFYIFISRVVALGSMLFVSILNSVKSVFADSIISIFASQIKNCLFFWENDRFGDSTNASSYYAATVITKSGEKRQVNIPKHTNSAPWAFFIAAAFLIILIFAAKTMA